MTVTGGSKLSLTRVLIAAASEAAVLANSSTLTIAQSTITFNSKLGISVSGGRLDLTQSTITSNLGGGIYTSGAEFDITNNIIAANGTISTSLGGVSIDVITERIHTFEFNTIAGNWHLPDFAAVSCSATALFPLTLSNNIVYGNTDPQVGGTNCAFTYSDIGPAMAAGTGNINTDPMFINPAAGDYHLGPSSPAREVADPAATIGVDLDGDPRPQGARRDIGADEVKP
jgi:hypothetical protein